MIKIWSIIIIIIIINIIIIIIAVIKKIFNAQKCESEVNMRM